jgi:hypothetical protein
MVDRIFGRPRLADRHRIEGCIRRRVAGATPDRAIGTITLAVLVANDPQRDAVGRPHRADP